MHVLRNNIQGEAEANGTTFSYNTTVIGGDLEGNEMSLYVLDTKFLESWDQTSPLHPELILIPKIVVNSAGLSAPILARQCSFLSDSVIPPAHYARGSYFTLSNTRETPFRHLIYPIPEEGGLGVHVTLDLDRRVKFGPDVEWIDGLDEISCFRNRYSFSRLTTLFCFQLNVSVLLLYLILVLFLYLSFVISYIVHLQVHLLASFIESLPSITTSLQNEQCC